MCVVLRSKVPIGPIKEEKEILRQKELRQMKAKYGLKVSTILQQMQSRHSITVSPATGRSPLCTVVSPVHRAVSMRRPRP